MNTHQLNVLASSCPTIGPTFLGVFASNELPTTAPSKPCCLIANLDTTEQSGSHWVCVHFPARGLPEYMDSYGFPPLLASFRGLLGPSYRYNCTSLQNPFSAVCGQYCLYYLFQRALHPSMDSVLRVFNPEDYFCNDLLVNRFVEKHFDTNLNMFDLNWQLHQLSRPYA